MASHSNSLLRSLFRILPVAVARVCINGVGFRETTNCDCMTPMGASRSAPPGRERPLLRSTAEPPYDLTRAGSSQGRPFGQRRSISRLWLLAAKSVSARRGSRMRSTGGAGVRKAHVLDAGLVVSPKMRRQVRTAQRAMSDRPSRCFTFRIPSSEPIGLTRPVTGHDQPHIRSPPMRGRQNPACGGRGSGGRHHSTCRRLKPWP